MTIAELREAIRAEADPVVRAQLESELRERLDGDTESQDDSGGHGGSTPPNDPR